MENNTTVYLTPEDAALFLQFQKRYLFMQVLESYGVFDIKNGSATIHFNNRQIVKVDKMDVYSVPLAPI